MLETKGRQEAALSPHPTPPGCIPNCHCEQGVQHLQHEAILLPSSSLSSTTATSRASDICTLQTTPAAFPRANIHCRRWPRGTLPSPPSSSTSSPPHTSSSLPPFSPGALTVPRWDITLNTSKHLLSPFPFRSSKAKHVSCTAPPPRPSPAPAPSQSLFLLQALRSSAD